VAAILEFVRSESAVFDPETVQMLASALDDAWARIEKAGSRFARPAYSRVMREVVAKRIIEMAQHGVTDQEKLAADAVRFISANYVENYSAKIESRKDRAIGLKPDGTVTGLSA
jgi:hypothetical protein